MSSAQPTRIAVIGTGYFAQFQIAAWQRLPDAQLVALCDLDRQQLQQAHPKAPQAKLFTDAETMLQQCQPDLVDIATPPPSHQSLVALCARYKLDCICQKPLAASYVEAIKLVDTADQAGITLAVHENFRFMPWYREIMKLIQNNKFGKLHNISMRLRPGDGQGPEAYLQRQPYFQNMERFLVHETAIHLIDTFRFLCGEVCGVFARLRRLNNSIAGEDAGLIIFDFHNGCSGLFDGNRLNEHVADNPRLTMGELWLESEAGVLRLDGFARLWFKPHGEPEYQHTYVWQNKDFAGDCVYATQQHILAHFRTGSKLENRGVDYLRNLEIEEAIYQSAQQQQWITV